MTREFQRFLTSLYNLKRSTLQVFQHLCQEKTTPNPFDQMKNALLFFFVVCLATVSAIGQTNPNRDKPFSWDNATVYFVVTDRFNNGNTSNDQSYGRGKDGNSNAYTFDQVGSFFGGDIAGLNQKITEGYFDNLGVNALWITAPYEQIHGWVAGKDGAFQHYAYHGYYPLDWSEMDANMGTKTDFQTFVDNAHAHGIRVLVDIVMNHTGYNTARDMMDYNFGCVNDSWKGWRPSSGQTWNNIHDFINYTSSCGNWSNWWGGNWVRAGLPGYPAPGGDDKTMSLAGLPDVITESTATVGLPPILNAKWNAAKKAEEQAELDAFFSRTGYPRSPRNYVVKWLTDWVREFGIDGFRVDTEKHVEGTAWKALKDQAVIALREWKANNPTRKLDDLDFWMTGENYGYCTARSDYAVNSGFDSYINFCFQGQAGNAGSYESLFSGYAATFNNDPQWNALSYISSHDTYLFNRGNLLNAGTSLLLLPGAVQIFYGDETARPAGPSGGDQPQETRSFMNWSTINQDVLAHWQKLGQFRRNHLAVGAGNHLKLKDSPYTFKRTLGNDQVIVVIGASGPTTIAVSSAFPNGTTLRDFYTGNTAVVSGGNVIFTAGSKGIILLETAAPSTSPTVSISPASGHFTSAFQVTLSATGPNTPVRIYYTTNGSTPTAASTLYSAPFTISANATVTAIAIDAQNQSSTVATNVYTVGPVPTFIVNFKKPANWSTGPVKIYYWNTLPSGSMPTVAWPGVNATLDNTTGWYTFTFSNVTSTNLIFNDNGSTTNKTADLTRTTTGWYKDGVWYNTNPEANQPNSPPVVTVSPAGPQNFTTSAAVTINATDDSGTTPTLYYTTDGTTPTTSSPSAAGTRSLSFTTTTTLKVFAVDNLGSASAVQTHNYTLTPATGLRIHLKTTWPNPRIYFWNAGGATITWPGAVMTPEGNGWHVYTIPNASCANIIFSNNGATQTADLYRCGEGWYDNGVWHNSLPATPTGLTIHLKTTWASPKIYYWNATPGGATTTWPGVTMASEGNGWYMYTIPNATCSNIIFSNNGASQTANLTRCGEGWYNNGTWTSTLPSGRTATQENSDIAETLTTQGYPNPADDHLIIRFNVPQRSSVNLKLHNDQGREIKTVMNAILQAGSHEVVVDTKDFRPGLYIYRLAVDHSITIKKFVIAH
jgi:alpha-amylase